MRYMAIVAIENKWIICWRLMISTIWVAMRIRWITANCGYNHPMITRNSSSLKRRLVAKWSLAVLCRSAVDFGQRFSQIRRQSLYMIRWNVLHSLIWHHKSTYRYQNAASLFSLCRMRIIYGTRGTHLLQYQVASVRRLAKWLQIHEK